MTKYISKVLFASIFALCFYAWADSPSGFIVWAEGDHENRELKYVDLEEGSGVVEGSKKTFVDRGDHADIECVISMDGKWVAFARQLESNNCCYDGPGDYHMFGNYDIYIAEVDPENMPVEPIHIGHGYWPSWSDDSDQPTKTLYFSHVPGDGRGNEDLKIMKTTVSSDGSFTDIEEHLDVPENSGDGHMQVSPDGRHVAYRTSGIKLWDSETGTTTSGYGGCHPSWAPDSYWIYWANSNIGAATDGSINDRTNIDFPYHAGWSNDMKWIIGREGNYSNDQNTPHPLQVYSIEASARGEDPSFSKNHEFTHEDGTWCDIHVHVEPPEIEGCMDENYEEYNPDATVDGDPTLCVTLGINQKLVREQGFRFSYQMSPSQGLLVKIAEIGIYNLEITNLDGQVLHKVENSSARQHQFTKESFSSGLYTISVTNKSGKTSQLVTIAE